VSGPAHPAFPPAHAALIASRRRLADQVFSRAAGAPLLEGNHVELRQDAEENYPAWIEAIDGAEHTIHFEMYIFSDDATGQRFADRLCARAREGVTVRVLYDWLGARGRTPRRFWRRLRRAGCEVRCVNPPRLQNPLGWLSRDHRKLLTVDGRLAFVTGLCIGSEWEGDPARGVPAWRDTGVSLRGPVVADCERAFADVWATGGEPLPEDEIPSNEEIPSAGEMNVRLIATEPDTAGLFRLDLVVAGLARNNLWLADAYFAGNRAYIDTLRSAVGAGVDVRLLVPGVSDVPVVANFSRTMYRPLLEGGVRVFEWNGPMMHAKTAVADGRWARVGSTNLNAASWFGNWELDVAVEDESFARTMEEAYRRDLDGATEIVLGARRKVEPRSPVTHTTSLHGSTNRAAAAALRASGAVGAALSNPRSVGAAESSALASFAVPLAVLAVVAFLFPRLVAWSIAGVAAILAGWLLQRSIRLRRWQGRDEAPPG
jgi:cardiolipin synthase